MKFFTTFGLIATVASQNVCSDDDYLDVCVDGACCGYLVPVEGGKSYRACSMDDQSGAEDYDGEDIFSCDPPIESADEEGAAKLALGLSAFVATLYMA